MNNATQQPAYDHEEGCPCPACNEPECECGSVRCVVDGLCAKCRDLDGDDSDFDYLSFAGVHR